MTNPTSLYRSQEQVLYDLSKALHFSPETLEINRQGRVSSEQIKRQALRCIRHAFVASIFLFVPLFLITLAIAAGTGFLLAHRWIRAGKPGRVLVGLGLGLALSVGVVLVTPSAPMFVGHLDDYRAYTSAALSSGDPSKYGIVSIGPWTLGMPWVADREILARHNLITCLNPRFLIPLLIDSAIYFGCTAALAIWFRRQNAGQLIDMPRSVFSGGRRAGRQ